MKTKVDVMEVLNAAENARSLNALLEVLFERGNVNCKARDDLIGLAWNICGKVCAVLDKLEEEENK